MLDRGEVSEKCAAPFERRAVPLASPDLLNRWIPWTGPRKFALNRARCPPFEIGLGSVICTFICSMPPGGTVSSSTVSSTPAKGGSAPKTRPVESNSRAKNDAEMIVRKGLGNAQLDFMTHPRLLGWLRFLERMLAGSSKP